MTAKKDPYASEAETQALLVPDTRMKAERKLAQMMAERGADEQGAEAYLMLRQIAVDLLAEQPYEIGARLAREGKGISDLWGAVKSDADMAEAKRGYEAALADQPAQRKPLPRILDIWNTGQASLQIVFKNRSDADEYRHAIKDQP